jgi:aminopeptidase N
MNKINLIIIILLVFQTINYSFAQTIQYRINSNLNPDNHTIKVSSEIDITIDEQNSKYFTFKLNRNLTIISSNVKVEKQSQNDSNLIYCTYKIIPNKKKPVKLFTIVYEGKIFESPDAGLAEYARGFSQTNGIISKEGVYLAGSTYWIPTFNDEMYTFNLTSELPTGWKMVSQGEQSIEGNKTTYNCQTPQEEIYLIAAPFTFYEKLKDGKKIQAFLRTPDNEIARKYIEATIKYMEMYEKMIGEYPYSKFSLVENFWETGYGMPSFTLLGEKVIRFPFIINSSYPHELLHNYWGNSVYVDYTTGNWCEGITAYMADHLLKEQEGQGVEYRRSTLQKYTDYINEENDFALNQFISRNNPAEEAIGYGKSLMMNHMLRQKTGDNKFLDSYRNFYETNKFKKASYNDIATSFKIYNQWDVQFFFDQWVNGVGAPKLSYSDMSRTKTGDLWKISFFINQTQTGQAFNVDVPVAIYFADTVIKVIATMDSKDKYFSYVSIKKPLKIEIDPEYDIFRILDRRETPSSVSQIMGSKNLIIILPSKDPNIESYKTMAETFKGSNEAQGLMVKIVSDNEIAQIPDGVSIWVLGKTNKFSTTIFPVEQYKNQLSSEEYSKLLTAFEKGSLVLTTISTSNSANTYGLIIGSEKDAISGLTRLLPHYGKYSVLTFEGARPTNTSKITLRPSNSPLHIQFDNEPNELNPQVRLKPHKPLVN